MIDVEAAWGVACTEVAVLGTIVALAMISAAGEGDKPLVRDFRVALIV